MSAECRHEWKDEYYGTRCVKCDLFYPFGCAPWDTEDAWDREEDYIEMCGEGINQALKRRFDNVSHAKVFATTRLCDAVPSGK